MNTPPKVERIRAAGGIVLGDGAVVAMICHKNGTGTWFFPKGRVEPGEDEETTARREIEEETGLTDLEYLDDFGTYERYHMSPAGVNERTEIKEIRMFLFAAKANGNIRPDHEIAAVKWVPISRVAQECGSVRDRAWFATIYERLREAVNRD